MITVTVMMEEKGLQAGAVEKVVLAALRKHYPKMHVDAVANKHKPATSRADRFSEAQSSLADAKSGAEMLKEELEEWKNNLPENLQDGDKASQLENAINQLEEFVDACDTAEGVDVEFPSMMG